MLVSSGGRCSFCRHQQTGIFIKNRRWKPIYCCDVERLLGTDESYTDSKQKGRKVFQHYHGALGRQLWNTVQSTVGKWSQFTSKFFAPLGIELGVKMATTTEQYLLDNGPIDRFNALRVLRIRHYVIGNHKNSDMFVVPLSYVYNIQVHRSTNLRPFRRTITRLPAGPASKSHPIPPDTSEINVTVPIGLMSFTNWV